MEFATALSVVQLMQLQIPKLFSSTLMIADHVPDTYLPIPTGMP